MTTFIFVWVTLICLQGLRESRRITALESRIARLECRDALQDLADIDRDLI